MLTIRFRQQSNILTEAMQRVELLTKLIEKGEKRVASDLLDKIYGEHQCFLYAAALEKILLVQTAKLLNDTVSGFYLDSENLAAQLFSQTPPARDTVLDTMCTLICDAAQENRLYAFEKAAEYIRCNLCDNQLTIKAAAEYAGVSQSALVKLFMQNAGVKPLDYLSKLRVEESLEYLEKNMSTKQAALNVGFSSCEAYIRAFKKHMGNTPGLWKRNKLFL